MHADATAIDEQPPTKKVKTAEAPTEEAPNGHAAEEEEEEVEEVEEEEEEDAEGEGDDAEADDDAEAEEETADASAPAKEAVKPAALAPEVKAVAAGGDDA